MAGLDVGSFWLGAAIVLLVVLAIDLLVAGGAMSMGMMGGVGAMIGTPIGWVLLLILIVVVVATFMGR